MNAEGRARIAHPYVLLTLSALFWASSAIVARHVAGEVPPMAMNFWRWAFAFLLALGWTWPEVRRHRALIVERWRYLSMLAITSAVTFGALHFTALQYTTAINGALFQGMLPITIVCAAWILLRERIGPVEIAGIAFGVAGLAVIVTRGDLGVLLGLTFNVGDLLLFAAAVSYSVYACLLRRAPRELSASALMTVMFALAALYMLPLWLGEVFAFDRPTPLNVTSLWSIGFLTVFPSLLAQIFWASAVARTGPARAGYFIYLSPVFGIVLAIGLLGEHFQRFHAIGIALIVAGVWLAALRRKPG